MRPELQELLSKLEKFSTENDRAQSDRQQKMLNITPDTGPFLSLLLQNCKARKVLEVGTSNGYSTLWIADALRQSEGLVVTIEIQDHKFAKAKENFRISGLDDRIQQVLGDAGEYLKKSPKNNFDAVFLDSDREQYADWWTDLMSVLKPGGLLIVDNATSHAHELEEFLCLVQKSQFTHSLVPIGNGELLVLKPW